jgi:hypothetical protein
MKKMNMRFAQLNGPGDEDETLETTTEETTSDGGGGDEGGE